MASKKGFMGSMSSGAVIGAVAMFYLFNMATKKDRNTAYEETVGAVHVQVWLMGSADNGMWHWSAERLDGYGDREGASSSLPDAIAAAKNAASELDS